ncbi:DUF305 domain-containing protein [Pseudonocardia sp.]|uniref:DUF305 domain-containing protein n=1 Tax=Pseudonocardia sp. TaxID=60912 RepID=UPI00261B94A9|nr:DUF305 domain-containing protein [Pseudonocardia sp.]
MPDTDTLPAPPTARPAWPRYLVAAGAAVALLLLGAAVGVLIGLPGSASEAAPGADSVDVGFAQDMTVHHEQAVEMATWERDHSTDPQVRQLAYDIESGQSRQIGHMQGWLALWGAPGLPTGPHMRWMSGAEGHPHGAGGMSGMTGVGQMPGMATDDDLRRLRASTGPELDTLFLQLMVRHHEGGTTMLAYAARHAATPDVRTQAGKMLAAQTAESRYLRDLLAARNAAPLPG